MTQRRLNAERVAVGIQHETETIDERVLKAKHERVQNIRINENRVSSRGPIAQRRLLNQLREEHNTQQVDHNNAESGSVGQQSEEALPT